MVPHGWVKECIDLFAVAENVTTFLDESIYKWIMKLTSPGISLGNVNVRRGLFQEASLSPSLGMINLILLTFILRK